MINACHHLDSQSDGWRKRPIIPSARSNNASAALHSTRKAFLAEPGHIFYNSEIIINGNGSLSRLHVGLSHAP